MPMKLKNHDNSRKLLQEHFLPDQWKVLVVCIFLNCTQRAQVEKMIWDFFEKFPTPQALLEADDVDIANTIRSLGFYNRRTKLLKRFCQEYVSGKWSHASELHGIGEYGARAWEMLCLGTTGNTRPNDHALAYLYDLRTSQ